MTKKKRFRFEENKTFSNLFQLGYHEVINHGFPLKGKWHRDYFENDNPLILELGCGKGEYSVELARQNPDKNFIGIDIKGARLWKGCKISNEENLSNVAFIRTRVDLINLFFGNNEVSAIWITFPDPQPQKPRERKRLTSPVFLERYKAIIKTDGLIHLKTDNQQFYNYTLDVINDQGHECLFRSDDIYNSGLHNEVTSIKTYYESMFLEKGISITYIKFRLKHEK